MKCIYLYYDAALVVSTSDQADKFAQDVIAQMIKAGFTDFCQAGTIEPISNALNPICSKVLYPG